LPHLYFKLESGNPSGSYKDRFAAAAVSAMRAAGKTRCIATSSGNTGAALAAYTAAAGIECRIAIVETAPDGKLRQMLAYGANIFRVRGFGLDPEVSTDAFVHLQRMAARADSALQISAFTYSPVGMSGVQTISYELAEQEPRLDHVFAPAGGGGLCVAIARGFARLVERADLPRSPAVEVVQPEGNDTMATPLATGEELARNVAATTRISGLQVPSVIDGNWTISECRASGGSGHTVTDEFIWELQRRLAREEGIFCEPAGATALAGALQAVRQGRVRPDAHIACLVTGTGFKDEASVTRMLGDSAAPMLEISDLADMQ
jgi:threonine synthase